MKFPTACICGEVADEFIQDISSFSEHMFQGNLSEIAK